MSLIQLLIQESINPVKGSVTQPSGTEVAGAAVSAVTDAISTRLVT